MAEAMRIVYGHPEKPFNPRTFCVVTFHCKYSYDYTLKKHHKFVWPKAFRDYAHAQAWMDAWNWSYRFEALAGRVGLLGEGGRGRITSMCIEQRRWPKDHPGWQ